VYPALVFYGLLIGAVAGGVAHSGTVFLLVISCFIVAGVGMAGVRRAKR
jgi:hypothetical protein